MVVLDLALLYSLNFLELTWYLLRMVLHTPVTSIIVTRKGMRALFAILPCCLRFDRACR